MGRRPEDKQAIVASFDEAREFWARERDMARRPWSRWFARGMARWAAGGATDYRERIAEEERRSAGAAPDA
jgi:hypothetical protein